MKPLLRILGFAGLGIAAVLAAVLIYLAFGDLGRHKGRIESLASQRLGRPFAIDGPFRLELFPAVKIEAEAVRLGNSSWGSTPQMIQVGRFATEVDLWSLVSGPINVRTLELRDVTVVLERNDKGQENWVLGEPKAKVPASDETSEGFTKLPVAFQHAALSNLKVIYRAPGVPDHIATIENLGITPDPQGLLGLEGNGSLDGYKAQLTGKVGPIKSLLSGHDIQLDLAGGFGNLRFAAKGGFGRLNPLDGADLAVSVGNPDLGTLLRNLRLPAIAAGQLDVKLILKDAGERTDLDLTAGAGDLSLHTTGKLKVLGLRDSDLKFTARAADAARLASVFDIRNVPTGELVVSGHMTSTPKALKIEGFHATLAGYEARIDGSIPAQRGGAAQIRFAVTAPNLADLKPNLPSLPLKASGVVAYKSGPKGKPGSLEALLSARNLQLDVGGDLGKTHFTAQGGVGRLDPLEGADVKVSVANPDFASLLQGLRLPAVASGSLAINATLKKAGKRTDLDLTAQGGDLSLHTTGSVAQLGLRDSDLTFTARAADASRLATLFDIKGVPAAALAVDGHLLTSAEELRFDSVRAKLGEIEAQVDGALPRQSDRLTQLHFNLTATSLKDLKAGLPPLPLKISGDLAHRPDEYKLTKLVALVGESRLQGSATLRTKERQVIADIDAPLLDLSPFLEKKSEAQAGAAPAAKSAGKEKKRFLFGEEPIPFAKLGTSRDQVHLTSAEIRLAKGILQNVDSTVKLDDGKLTARLKARGGFGGSVDGSLEVTPVGNGSAALKLDLAMQDVRSGLASGDAVRPEEVPPVNFKASITSTGATLHELASVASGSVLFTQGPGKSKSSLLDRIGGDIIGQLLSKLNPFSKQDPYTQVDCAVARMDITDGKARVEPVLMQTRKVAITASGNIDLKTEKLLLNFNTRPRQGIGISPGMFTNPFLDLTGTLASPSIGVGGKGVASGAVAAATGGLSVLAKGAVDRAMGEINLCADTLAKAQQPAKAAHVP